MEQSLQIAQTITLIQEIGIILDETHVFVCMVHKMTHMDGAEKLCYLTNTHS
jgi:hypothetical protein